MLEIEKPMRVHVAIKWVYIHACLLTCINITEVLARDIDLEILYNNYHHWCFVVFLLQHVDYENSTICGYLKIQGLTDVGCFVILMKIYCDKS